MACLVWRAAWQAFGEQRPAAAVARHALFPEFRDCQKIGYWAVPVRNRGGFTWHNGEQRLHLIIFAKYLVLPHHSLLFILALLALVNQ